MRSVVFSIFVALSLLVMGQPRYEFDFSGKTLYEVVEELSRKHRFKFSYNPAALKKHTLDKKIKANSEADLISAVFDELPFKIQLADGIYLVIPKKLDFQPSKLAGQIKDQSTGKPLAYAHVQVNNKGTISNQEGQFSLPPREDTVTLQISYIGYKSVQLDVPPAQDEISLQMEQNPMVLQEVILNSKDFNDLAGRASFFSMNPDQFNSLPMLGETDVFKSIQLLPGIKATDETSSGLSVRGGSPSQNLILLDGFTLYHLDHFFGIFSTLNPNVINNVSVYKGGFGPQYGGRISSVVDVSGKTGSTDDFSAKVGVNLLSYNAMIETPIGKKSSLLIGTRQSFTGLLNSGLFEDFLSSNREGFLESIDPEIASYDLSPSIDFYDLNAKFQHRFSNRSILDVNLYASEDFYTGNFFEEDDNFNNTVLDKATWANGGVSLDWKYNFSPSWSSSFTFGASDYTNDEQLAITQTFFIPIAFGTDTVESNTEVEVFDYSVSSSVGDVTLKSDHEIELDNRNVLNVGMELNNITSNFDVDQSYLSAFSNGVEVTDTLTVESTIASFYGNYLFLGENITSNVGLRTTFYEPTEQWYLEPRLDLKFKINDLFNLKGAASFHHQFVNQTSLDFFQNNDKFYWVLADDESIPVLDGTHLILGGSFASEKWTVDLEYYRKNTQGIIENVFVSRNPAVLDFILDEDLNTSGENNTQGMDLFVKYRTERFTSWLSYSLANSENNFWYINQNTPYPSNQDQRHEINFVNTVKVKNWEFSSIMIYGSGKPYSIPLLDEDDNFVFEQDQLNNYRLPAYQRMDLSAKNSFSIGNVKCEAGITFFNVFDTPNIKSRRFAQQILFDEVNDALDEDEVRIVALDTRLLGFTPNFFFNIRF